MGEVYSAFRTLFLAHSKRRLDEVYREAAAVSLDGRDTQALKKERDMLTAFKIPKTDDRAVLVAAWPVDSLGPLPLWFGNPAGVAKADPSKGSLVIDLSKRQDEEVKTIDPKSEAAILKKRAERAPRDDDARKAFIAKQPAKLSIDQVVEQALGVKMADLRKALTDKPAE